MCPDEDSLCGIRTIRRFSETLIQPYVRTYARTGNELFLKTAAHDSRILNVALEYAWIKNAVLEQEKFKMLLWKTGFTENQIKNRILFKVLLPDDENDPTSRGIRFSKKAGI